VLRIANEYSLSLSDAEKALQEKPTATLLVDETAITEALE
jgi:hypothetical protein